MNWKDVAVESTKHTLIIKASPGGAALPVSERLIRSLPHPDKTASVWHVRFTPEGKLFTAGYPSGVVQIWDVPSGKEIRRIDSPRGYRGSAEYALTSADFAKLFVPTDNRKAKRVEDDPKRRFEITYNGQMLVWDLKSGKSLPAIDAPKNTGFIAAELSPDGKRLLTVERSGHLGGENSRDVPRLYDLATGKPTDLGEGYGSAAFAADGKRMYLALTRYSGKQSSALKVFDLDGKEVATLGRQEGSRNYSRPLLSPDGKLLALNVSKGRINEPGAIQLYDLAANKVVAEFASEGDFPYYAPTFSPDGKWLAAGDYSGRVTIWGVTKRELWTRVPLKKDMAVSLALAFSPDSKTLAIPVRIKTDLDRDRDPDPLDLPQPRVFLFDVAKKGEPEEIVCPHGWTGGIAFAPDGKTFAFGSAGAVHLFDITKPRK